MAEFDKGAAQVGSCRSHDTSTKEPSEECGQDRPPHLYSKNPKNFDAPYHNEYPLCPLLSQALICAVMPRRGAGAAVKVGWGGTQIVAAFDLKVASPLLVLRDPWRTRLALI